MKTKSKKILEYTGIGLFVIVVGWGTLLVIDFISGKNSPEQLSEIPDSLKLKSIPQDVIYAETKETEDGRREVKYAYVTDEVPAEEGEDISRRTPDSRTEVLEIRQEGSERIEKLKTTFLSKPQFYQDGGTWRQIEYATTTEEVFAMSGAIPHIKKREFVEWLLPGKPVFAVTSTYYPDANTETTSVDGYSTSFSTVSFSDAVNKTSGTSCDSCTSLEASTLDTSSGTSFDVGRGFILFDTSSLPDSAEVTDTTLSLYASIAISQDNDGQDTVNIVSSSPASDTVLVNDDFDQVGSTLYASAVDISIISTAAYTVFNFNATGIASVNLAGITKLAAREGHDLANSPIAASSVNLAQFYSAERAGTSQDPKLAVTYTADSFSFGQWFPF